MMTARSFSFTTPPSNPTAVTALLPRVPPLNSPSPSVRTTSPKPSTSLDLTALPLSLPPLALADTLAMVAAAAEADLAVLGVETTPPMVDGVTIAAGLVTSLVTVHRVRVVLVEFPAAVETATHAGSPGTLPENAEVVAVTVEFPVADLEAVTTVVNSDTWLGIAVRTAAALVVDSAAVVVVPTVVFATTVENLDILLGNALTELRFTYSVI